MTDGMSHERFRALARSYGSVIARWPEGERDAALILARDPDSRRLLAEAALLDDALDTWRVTAPSRDLAGRILTCAPRPALRPRLRLWWSGIGIAAAIGGAVAGAIAGAAVAPASLPDFTTPSTAFGDLSGWEN